MKAVHCRRAFQWIVTLSACTTFARADNADVIVYGGTAGGAMSAVAAAREGVSVILLEPGTHLGGMVSGGLGWGDVNRPEIVGGYAREYFQRVGRMYGKEEMVWHIEPHIAERVFDDMTADAKVIVKFGQRLRETNGVITADRRIVEVSCESGQTFQARVFIDASYEGDLMAQAGVLSRIGRESTHEYDEPSAGVRRLHPAGRPGGAVDEKGVLPLVHPGPAGEFGSADSRVQSYNFRLCLTRRADNRVEILRPQAYDPRDFELIARELAAKPSSTLAEILSISRLPNDKTDINNGGFSVSTDLPNASWTYPAGSYAERERIRQRHKDYTLGLLWFLGNDPRVPETLRRETGQWGLAADEFADTDHFPRQLYVREGRRMVGAYVMTEKDARTENEKSDSIGMGSYMMDCHPVQRVLLPDNDFANEGHIGGNSRILPYEIPYRALTPRGEECANLVVPVCLSVSHVVWASIRMEPQFMLVGHAAGVAAALAAKAGVSVQEVPIEKLQARLKVQGQVLKWKLPGLIDLNELAGVVVDDDQAEFTGQWKTANTLGPLVGTTYRYIAKGDGHRAARFTPRLPAGRYEVRMFYSSWAKRASNVKVVVHHADGETDVILDESRPMPAGGVTVGVFDFAEGGQGCVEIVADGADGVVIVDAIQWLPIP